MNAHSYMQSILWCCSSCGFVLEGGQPHMECPLCEAYKDAFIDTPGQVEASIRATFGNDASNTADARRARLAALRAGGFLRTYRVKGRVTEAVNSAAPSRRLL
jgi:rubredoxin